MVEELALTWRALRWSLSVATRSFIWVVGVAVFCALWVLTAYLWLDLPESSALILAVAALWALAQCLLAVAALLILAASVVEAAQAGAPRLSARSIRWAHIGQCVVFTLSAGVVIVVLGLFFSWLNEHSLEVASFLTLHLKKPVSRMVISGFFGAIEAILWVLVAGLLAGFLMNALASGWRPALGGFGGLLARCWRAPVLVSLIIAAFFGWTADALINWHPLVKPGGWDFAQLILRFGLSLLLLAFGWLVWMLGLARLNLVPARETSVTHL
jgi:hypothetical protein